MNELGRRDDQGVPVLTVRQRAHVFWVTTGIAAAFAWLFAAWITWSPAAGMYDPQAALTAIIPGGKTNAVIGNWALAIATWVVLTVPVVALLARLLLKTPTGKMGKTAKGLADVTEIARIMGEKAARDSAAQTRPRLTKAQRVAADITDLAMPIGATQAGTQVFANLQEHVQCMAPTGAGKTQTVMIPAMLAAPGAAIATSTRADILDVVATRRVKSGRNVWVFDPLGITGWPHRMAWNPVTGCEDTERAIARAEAFQSGVKSGPNMSDSSNAGFFKQNASTALACLLHAAALGGRDFSVVLSWGLRLDENWQEPYDIIFRSEHPEAEPIWADQLKSIATGAKETTSSTRQTLAQSLTPLASRRILEWVTPGPGRTAFTADEYVTSRDDLHIICDDNRAQNVAPLCAMLLQEVTDAGKTAAYRTREMRLDPPMRLVGDELVNVAPLPKMPELATDARAWGLQIVAAWQSDDQAEKRWGKQGAATLTAQMAVQVVLPGITDIGTLERLSKLSGQVDVTKASATYNPTTGAQGSTSMQTIDKPVLRPDEIRRIGSGSPHQALLIHRNASPVLVNLTPWYASSDAAELEADRDRVRAARYTHLHGGTDG